MNIQRFIQWIVGVAGIASILFFVYYTYTTSTRDYVAVAFLVFLALAALSPVGVWWWLSSRLRTLSAKYALLIGAVVVFTAGGLIYYDAFFVHLDALNALVLLFLPPWQIGAIGLVFGVSYFLERRRAHDAA